jgi:predicted RNA-binding protein with PIN domain
MLFDWQHRRSRNRHSSSPFEEQRQVTTSQRLFFGPNYPLRFLPDTCTSNAPDLWQNSCMPYWFDGNNLIGQSAGAAATDPRLRNEFLSTLSAYHKSGGGRFLVYFDGDDPGRSSAPPGVAVRYSAPLSADEYIFRRLHEVRNAAEVIVVTNDRGLMSSCKSIGAATMNWTEFSSKMRSRSPLRDSRREKQESVDVEDWMRYFGLK